MKSALYWLVAILLDLTLLAPAVAVAAPGERQAVAVSAERLVGLHFSDARQDLADGSQETQRWFGIGRGWSGGGPLSVPYEARRIGADLFVIDSVSIGTGVAFAYRATDDAEYWEMLVAPRLGYLVTTSRNTFLWFRAGPYYHRSNIFEGAERGWGAGAEAVATVMFLNRLGLNVTPAFDHSFDVERAGLERRYRSLSLTFGLVGWAR